MKTKSSVLGTLSAGATAGLIAAPAFAGHHMMSCATFAGLSDNDKIQEIVRLEPMSVEQRSGADATKGSSGPMGTVDPNMLEAEKAAKVEAACDANPDMTTGQAFNEAFK